MMIDRSPSLRKQTFAVLSRHSLKIGKCVLMTVCSAGAAAAAVADAPPTPGYPPPGEYRIDSDTATSDGNDSPATRKTVGTDGATGDQVHSWKGPDGTSTSRTFKGNKPVTTCVRPATAPGVLVDPAAACRSFDKQSSETGSSFSATCRNVSTQHAFRRIDARTWEHTMTAQILSGSTPARSAREAMAAGLPGMSAADQEMRKRAMADVPSQSKMNAMNAELLRDAEESVRTASSPEDAESARLSLQKLREVLGGTAVQRKIETRERWTLISPTCSSAR